MLAVWKSALLQPRLRVTPKLLHDRILPATTMDKVGLRAEVWILARREARPTSVSCSLSAPKPDDVDVIGKKFCCPAVSLLLYHSADALPHALRQDIDARTDLNQDMLRASDCVL